MLTLLSTVILLIVAVSMTAAASDTVYNTTDITGGVRIDSVTTEEKVLVIPNEIDGKPVIAIALNALANTPVEEITIPATVTKMNDWTGSEWYSSLYSMEHLTKVTFADGMRSLPDSALFGCAYVKEVVLPESITVISNNAFSGCVSLTTINIPDSITSIGDSAFANCSALDSFDLPDSLTVIGKSAFSGCAKFTEITLPDTVTTIGLNAFGGTKISEITIPATVTKMNDWTGYAWYSSLYSMEYLTKVTFADGMRSLPDRAVIGCAYLEEVVIYDCNSSVESLKETGKENGFTVTVLECQECFHTETVIKNAVAATCTQAGYSGDTHCAKCDELISAGETIAATGHNFSDWTVVVPATTTAEGSEERICDICEEKETRQIEKLNFLIGDVNCDGKINAADARIALRVSAKLENFETYNVPFEVFDITRDNNISAADARKILRISAKLETA